MEWRQSEIAERIKDAVDMRQVAELYGFRVDRAGYMLCPFHHEKTASMKVYPKDGGYRCFGCGASGDVIGFVMEYEGLSFIDACRRLDQAFGLHLPFNGTVKRSEAREAGRRIWLRRKLKEAQERAIERAKSAYWTIYDKWLDNLLTIQKNMPMSQFEPFNEAYVEAVQMQSVLEYALDRAETRLYEAEKGLYNS